jgi:ankyrin repeat protein
MYIVALLVCRVTQNIKLALAAFFFLIPSQNRCKSGIEDPLEDSLLSLGEKHRIAGMWEIVRQNRHNPSLMIEKLRSLLVPGVAGVNAPSPDRVQVPVSSALQLACMYGDLSFTKMLVSRGENMDQVIMSPDNFGRGRCCLSVAAELGHNDVLAFLISAGADVRNVHDPPLRQAVRRNDLAAVSMLVNGGADPDPTLHQLLYPGCDLSVVRMLLEAGARPSGTMLLTALWRGCDSGVIELLLAYGAPFRSDLENESALEVAICRGAGRRVVEMLIRAGSKWSPKTHRMYPKVTQKTWKFVVFYIMFNFFSVIDPFVLFCVVLLFFFIEPIFARYFAIGRSSFVL